jgi:DNA polymerase III epsilon subunit-like protein
MIVVDVETTGLDEKRHSLIEIGAIDFYRPDDRFFVSCQAKPNCEINDIALKINGHTKEDVYDSSKPSQLEAITHFDDWLGKIIFREITIVGENPAFDLKFINQVYADHHMKSPLGHRSIDLHTTALNHLLMRGEEIPIKESGRISSIDSDWIMKYVGIPTEPKPHTGLNGAIWEAEAYSRLIFGKNLLEEFQKYIIPTHLLASSKKIVL